MAAVALLRSVASEMARAPPMHHRPLLARGLHAGARSEAGASGYTLPPASNEVCLQPQGSVRYPTYLRFENFDGYFKNKLSKQGFDLC